MASPFLEDLSDSDDVFAKEITKWNSNDFLDTLERPSEQDDVLGKTTAHLFHIEQNEIVDVSSCNYWGLWKYAPLL